MRRLYILLVVIICIGLSACHSDVQIQCDTTAAVSLQEDADDLIQLDTAPTVPTSQSLQPKKLNVPSGIHYGVFGDTNSEEYMDYYLFVPKNPVENMPLVIFLHGDGEVGMSYMMESEGLIVSARKVYGDDFPFLILQPCTRQKSWSAYGIPEILMGLINNIKSTYLVDSDKIIITGHSRGAIGVWNMVNTYGDYFSAAIPVSGAAYIPLNYENCIKVPVRCFTGDTWVEMQYYDVEILEVEAVNNAGGNAEIIILENTDHGRSYETAFAEETFRWMLNE